MKDEQRYYGKRLLKNRLVHILFSLIAWLGEGTVAVICPAFPAQQRGLGVGGQRVVGDRDDLPRAAGAGARGGGLRRRVRRGRAGPRRRRARLLFRLASQPLQNINPAKRISEL